MQRFVTIARMTGTLLYMCFWLVGLSIAAAAPMDEAADVAASWEKAFNAGDIDGIAAMYIEDATLFGTLSPNVTTGNAAVKAYFAGAAKNGLKVKLIDAPTVTKLADNSFVLVGLYEFSGMRPDGQSFVAPARYSFVTINRDGRWRIAHQHSSPRQKPQ